VRAPTKVEPGPTRIKKPFGDVLQTPYTAAQLALRYGFPVLKNTAKVWVAIIELSTPVGTGYSMKDVTKYCKQVRTASLSQEKQLNGISTSPEFKCFIAGSIIGTAAL
jgi:hypothetical protein